MSQSIRPWFNARWLVIARIELPSMVRSCLLRVRDVKIAMIYIDVLNCGPVGGRICLTGCEPMPGIGVRLTRIRCRDQWLD